MGWENQRVSDFQRSILGRAEKVECLKSNIGGFRRIIEMAGLKP